MIRRSVLIAAAVPVFMLGAILTPAHAAPVVTPNNSCEDIGAQGETVEGKPMVCQQTGAILGRWRPDFSAKATPESAPQPTSRGLADTGF